MSQHDDFRPVSGQIPNSKSMLKSQALIVGTLAFLSLTLSSCRSHSQWSLNRVESGSPQFDSTKLTFYSSDSINGIDLEFLNTHERLYAYLNIHSVPIPILKSDPKHIIVHLTIGEEKHHIKALRREGGQRFLLPEEAVNLILDALKKEQRLDLAISGYKTSIDPEGFSERYQKMQHTPLFQNPFHLPF